MNFTETWALLEDISNKKAILMSGPAGAGKSTWAKNYCNEHLDTIIISSDDVRYELFKSYYLPRDQEAQVKPEMIRRIEQASKDNKNIIVDVAVNKNKSRLDWYYKIKRYYKNVELVIIDTSVEKCLAQNKQRDRHVPDNIIRNMCNMVEIPTDEMKKLFSKITIINNN